VLISFVEVLLKSLLVPYHSFLKPFDIDLGLTLCFCEGLGFGENFGGKSWFRFGFGFDV
jgi:hypothetical protein